MFVWLQSLKKKTTAIKLYKSHLTLLGKKISISLYAIIEFACEYDIIYKFVTAHNEDVFAEIA